MSVIKKCFYCNCEFVLKSQYEKQAIKRGTKQFFCCSKCRIDYQKKNLSRNYKGKRRIQGKYVRVFLNKGVRRKLEHRIVMENFLGRKLKECECVHHINGDGTDNRIENLVLCKSQGKHYISFHIKRAKNGRFSK